MLCGLYTLPKDCYNKIMQPLKKQVHILQEEIAQAKIALQFDALVADLTLLDIQLSQPDIWNDPHHAQALAKKAEDIRQRVRPWQVLSGQLDDLVELTELSADDLLPELEAQCMMMEADFAELKKLLLFSGKYDTYNAIVRITAGVGGTDAQDFAEMLERMYLRGLEKMELSVRQIERSAGEEAGIKTSVLEVSGPYAYGKLRSENGVHRLVRLSPFNSDNLRQTSFALVEVLPDLDTPEDVPLEDKDLRIDVYRSGGRGGQGVNTTDSAVRVTHLPTGIVVAIQNERSQIQNKETALKILRSKLLAMQLEQHADSIADLRAGESANWGSQIRNYVLHPYTLVKDTRTKHEEKNAKAVLDGDFSPFIDAYLAHDAAASRE